MSSILDALNKLEQEKALAHRENERTDTDPVTIAHDLVGRSVLRDRVTLRVTPAAMMITAGALMVSLVAVTFVAARHFALPLNRGTQTAAVAGGAEAASTVAAVRPPESITSAPEFITKPASPPAVAEGTLPANNAVATPRTSAESKSHSDPTAAETGATPPAPSPAIAARQAEPKAQTPPASAEVAPKAEESPPPAPKAATASARPAADESVETPEPEADRPARTRVASRDTFDGPSTRRGAPGPQSIATRDENVRLDILPILTRVDQSRYGFVRIMVNMVKPVGDTNPQGSAILTVTEESAEGQPIGISMPFYEGQRVRQSTLKIFKVGEDRIGIEDMRTGERFQLPVGR